MQKLIFAAVGFAVLTSTAAASVINLTGTVTNSDGTPIQGAKARLLRAGVSNYSDVTGAFTLVEGVKAVRPSDTLTWQPVSVTKEQSQVGTPAFAVLGGNLNIKSIAAGTPVSLAVVDLRGRTLLKKSGFAPSMAIPELQKMAHQPMLMKIQCGETSAILKSVNGASFAAKQSLSGSTPISAKYSMSSRAVPSPVDTLVVSAVGYYDDTVTVSSYSSSVGTITLTEPVLPSDLNSLTADSLYKKGFELDTAGDHAAAAYYLHLAGSYQNSADLDAKIHWQYGHALYLQQAYDGAQREFGLVIANYPTDTLSSTAQLYIAKAWYFKAGSDSLLYLNAQTEFAKVLSNYPAASFDTKASAEQGIGESYYYLKNYTAAETAFRTVINQYSADTI